MGIDKYYRKMVMPSTKIKSLGDDSQIWVSPDGDDTNGDGTFVNPYASLTQAMSVVTTARKIIILMPGTYAEAAAVAWSTVSGVCVISLGGAGVTSISATGTSAITVTPGVVTSTWWGLISGVEIDHSAGAAQSGITFDNTGMTKKLLFYVDKCLASPDAETDKSINVETHDDADNSIRIYITGDGNQSEIGGAIYFNVNNLADRLHLENCWIIGTITTPNVAKEFRMRLYKCIVPHEAAVAGGNATQVVTAVGCYSWIDYDDITPEVYAALDTAELTGSHSEVIVA
jgi:hypothetical protein